MNIAHPESVSPELLETLFALSTLESLSKTALGGGTSLKIDILLHAYPLLGEYSWLDSVRCVSLPDMAAMKVNAVTNRGSKKDFSDLLLLYDNGISLTKSLQFFCAKYGTAGKFLAIRSLNWFEDADAEPDPMYLNGWTWAYVRERMMKLAEQLLH